MIPGILAAALVALFSSTSAHAQATRYWDSDGATAGFGTTTGTWGTSAFWTATATGGSPHAGVTTTANVDTVNFGTATLNYGNGTVGVAAGGVTATSIAFGSGQTTALTIGALTGQGTITLGGTTRTIVANSSGHSILSPIALTAATTVSVNVAVTATQSLTLGAMSGTGGLTLQNTAGGNPTANFILNGASTYSGNTTLDSTNTNASVQMTLGVANALPTSTVLSMNGGAGSGTGRTITLNMNGRDQTLAGLSGTSSGTPGGVSRTNRITNASGTLSTLTINGSSASTYAGLIGISGSANIRLVKEGTGTFTLSGVNAFGSNSYTGGTVLNQGTLTVTNDGSTTSGRLGATTGTLTVNNTNTGAGTAVSLNLATGVDTTVGTLSGTIATPSSGTNTATINTQTGRIFTVNQTAAGTYPGAIAGAGGFTLGSLSTNALTLTGRSTFTGNVTVSAGTLIAGINASGTSTALGNASTAGRTITVGSGATLRFDAGNVLTTNFSSSTVPAITVTGGTLTNSGTATNSALGSLTLNGGTLSAVSGTGNTSGYGVWNLNGTVTSTGTSAISSASSFPITLSAATGTNTTFDVTSGTLTASASLGQITASGDERTSSLTKSGAGTMILSGNNTFTGGVILNAGTLTLANAGALNSAAGSENAVTFGTSSTGILTLGGNSVVVRSLNSNATPGTPIVENANAGNAVLTIGNTLNLASSFAGVVRDGTGTGTLSLTKAGTNTLTLSGDNSYTGPTLVSAGTLALSSAGTINSTSGITVNGSGAKFLQASSVAVTPAVTLTQGTLTGSGTVNAVTVDSFAGNVVSNNDGVAGATLTIGSLTFSGAATINTFSNSTSAPIATTSLVGNGSAGQVTINASATSWAPGTYDLISYGGGSITGSGGFGQFSLGTVTGASARQTKTLGTSGTAITLTVGADDTPYWAGDGDGKWNLASTNNWKLTSNNSYTTFLASDNVLFNDSATGAGPITVDIDAANVAPSNTTFNNTTKDYVLSGAFGISTGSLTKNGTGTLTISNANTYAGATTINAGTLTLSGSGTLGTGSALTLGGGKLDLGSLSRTVGAVSVTAPAASGDTLLNGNLTGTSYAVSNTTGNVVISANLLVNGAAGLTKTGAGILTLTGTGNNYTGTTTISGGSLVIDDGTIGTSSSIVNNAALEYKLNANARTYANVISGGGTLTKSGTNTLTLSGINTYTGNTTINGGTLSMPANRIASSPTIFIGNGATWNSTASLTLAANQSITGTGTTGFVTTNNTGLLTTSGTTISSSGTLTFSRLDVRGAGNVISGGNIQSGSTATGMRGLLVGNSTTTTLTITGGTFTSNGGNANYDTIANTNATGAPNGTLIINGGAYVNTASNGRLMLGNGGSQSGNATLTLTEGSATINALEYNLGSLTGNTGTVNLDGGILTLSSIVSTAGTNRIFNFNGGQFIAGANLPTFSNLTMNVKDGGANINTNGFSMAISDPLLNNGTGGLTKSGLGTLTLSGANTYIGGTSVTGGTLRFSTAAASATNVTVSGGAEAGALVAADNAQWVNSSDLILQNNGSVLVDYGSTVPSSTTAPVSVTNFTNGTTPGVRVAGAAVPTLTVGQTLPLVTWSGTGPVNGSAFSLRTHRLSGTFSVASNTLSLTITNNAIGAISWNTGNGVWDTVATNWVDVNAASTAYVDPLDSVIFGDATGATGNPLVTLASTVSPVSMTVNTTGRNYTVSGAGSIGGSGALTLASNNLGTFTLSTANNTFSGGTSVLGGTLVLGDATNTLSDTGAVTVDGASSVLSLGANSDTVGAVSLRNGASITGSGTLTGTSYTLESGTISPTLGGAGNLTKSTAGTVTLSGAGTFIGTTTISGGTLRLANTSALASSSSITMNTASNSLELGTDAAFTTLPQIIGSSVTGATYTIVSDRATAGNGLTHALGTGSFGNATYSFVTGSNVSNGTAGISMTSIGFSGGGAGTATLSPGTGMTLTVGSMTTSNAAKTVVLDGTGTGAVTGSITNGNGLTLTKSNTSTWTLSGLSDIAANNYSGTTTIGQGTLVLTTTSPALTGGLTFGSTVNSTNTGTLDLSGIDTSATFTGALLVQTNSTVANTIALAPGKTLTVNGGLTMSNSTNNAETRLTMTGGGSFVVNGTSMIVGSNSGGTNISGEAHLNLAALASFSTTLSGNLTIQAVGDNSAGLNPASLTLSNTANSLTAAAVLVGNSSNGSTNTLWLGGGTNQIQTNLLNLGSGSRDTGVIDFSGNGGTITLRNLAGTGRVGNVNLGVQTTQATAYTTANLIDLTGNSADVAIATFATSLGAKTAANTNDLRFDTGTLDIRSINMAVAKGTGASTNRITIGGGTVRLGGSTAFSDAGTGTLTLATAGSGELIINGGTVTTTASLSKGAAGAGTATVTVSGGTLDMGNNSIGAATDIVVLNAQSGTLQNVAQVNNGAGWTKSTTGTLILAGTNAYTGAATVNAGILSITGTLNPLSTLAVGGGTLSFSGAAPQTVAGLTVNAGSSIITNTNAGTTNALILGPITRNTGGIVNFANATAANNVIQTTTANTNGILGAWAFVGSDWAMNDGSNNIVAYSGYSDVTRLNPGVIADGATTNVRIVEGSGSPGNITLGAATTTVNTLLQSDSGGISAATIDVGSGTLSTGGIAMVSAAGALTVGTAPNSGTLTAAVAGGGLILTNNSTGNLMTVNSVVADNTSASSLSKAGAGTVILSGNNTYTGQTTVTDGILRLGGTSASATVVVTNGTLQAAGNLPGITAASLSGTGTFDLYGGSQTLASLSCVVGNSITNSSTGTHASTATTPGSPALTDALTISAANATALPALITDGPTRKTQVVVNNNNGSFATNNPANSFSGGLVLANNSPTGTRLSPGTITGTPYGTGPIIIGQANTDRAGIFFATANQTLANPIIMNTALGTDRVGIRFDAVGMVLSGQLTANLAPITFSTNGTGAATLTGRITGSQGLILDSATSGASLTITLNNSSANNDYAGDTVIGQNATAARNRTLVLGAADQIPHGTGTGNVTINTNGTGVGTLNLAGFSETINGLNGNGVVDGSTGSPTLTLGGNNANGSFSGVIRNTSGTLAVEKTGTGTQTFAGVNTYTGSTTVSQGTLAFVGGSLTSPITVSTGASLSFDTSATTTSTSTANISLGTIKITGTPSAASHTLFTAAGGITGTPVLHAPVPGYVLKVVGNSLVLEQAGYGAWAALNGAGPNLNDDHDNDGVPNGVEYFLGGPNGNTTGFTLSPGVTNTAGTLSVTWVMGSGYAGVYGTNFTVETSDTLTGIWTTETAGVNVVVSGSNVTYTFPAPLGAKKFARLKVTGP